MNVIRKGQVQNIAKGDILRCDPAASQAAKESPKGLASRRAPRQDTEVLFILSLGLQFFKISYL